jgi:hypothetical protein
MESSFCEFTDIENQQIELVDMSISTTLREKSYHWMYPKLRKSKSCPNKLHLDTDITDESSLTIDTRPSVTTNRIHRENPYWNFYFFRIDKRKSINIHFSVFLHVVAMISFEIFFYFNYVVNIEKNEIIKKVESYIDQIKKIETEDEIIAIQFLVDTPTFQDFYAKLYKDYLESSREQKEKLHELLQKACYIGIPFFTIFTILLSYGLCRRKNIKWRRIFYENILMFLCLGVFEYLFFVNVILEYDPISDAELKYYILCRGLRPPATPC